MLALDVQDDGQRIRLKQKYPIVVARGFFECGVVKWLWTYGLIEVENNGI